MPIVLASSLSHATILNLCFQNETIIDEISLGENLSSEDIQELILDHLGIGIDLDDSKLIELLKKEFNVDYTITAQVVDAEGKSTHLFDTQLAHNVFDNDYCRNKIFGAKRLGKVVLMLSQDSEDKELVSLSEQDILSLEHIHQKGFEISLNLNNNWKSHLIITGVYCLDSISNFENECRLFYNKAKHEYHHSKLFDCQVSFLNGEFHIK